MSFPVFWEYAFKAALKTAWNFTDDAFKGEFEDIMLVESKMDTVVEIRTCWGGVCICCTCLHCPYHTGNQRQPGFVLDTEDRRALAFGVTVNHAFFILMMMGGRASLKSMYTVVTCSG